MPFLRKPKPSGPVMAAEFGAIEPCISDAETGTPMTCTMSYKHSKYVNVNDIRKNEKNILTGILFFGFLTHANYFSRTKSEKELARCRFYMEVSVGKRLSLGKPFG